MVFGVPIGRLSAHQPTVFHKCPYKRVRKKPSADGVRLLTDCAFQFVIFLLKKLWLHLKPGTLIFWVPFSSRNPSFLENRYCEVSPSIWIANIDLLSLWRVAGCVYFIRKTRIRGFTMKANEHNTVSKRRFCARSPSLWLPLSGVFSMFDHQLACAITLISAYTRLIWSVFGEMLK